MRLDYPRNLKPPGSWEQIMIKIDHFYVTVTDLTKAIIFYEGVLQIPITHREGNRWADFSDGNAVYFGIYNAKVDGKKFQTGISPTLCLKTKDIDIERGRIQRLKPSFISEIIVLSQPEPYKYFQFADDWGNVWEVAEYDY